MVKSIRDNGDSGSRDASNPSGNIKGNCRPPPDLACFRADRKEKVEVKFFRDPTKSAEFYEGLDEISNIFVYLWHCSNADEFYKRMDSTSDEELKKVAEQAKFRKRPNLLEHDSMLYASSSNLTSFVLYSLRDSVP